ncbi:MAG: response regulator [Proteobacteria bacterium]|nr:response regulator [Pseudomonadota bacterium]
MADYNIENLKFLVVDDDANMRHLVTTILSSLGVRNTATANSAEKGFGQLYDFDADIVICDLRMEPLDGLEFTKMIRNHDTSPNRYVPIIMLTGHSELSAVEQARDAGVHEFIAKPVSATRLYAKIKRIIEHPRAFIRTEDYFGPDRRRRQDPDYNGPERRKAK